ncbi:hypothetical protein JMUB7530_27810 [Staphylococcus aureus]
MCIRDSTNAIQQTIKIIKEIGGIKKVKQRLKELGDKGFCCKVEFIV